MSNRFGNLTIDAGAGLSRMRKTWRCATVLCALVAGAVTVNLAGCGGGGGGGGVIQIPDVSVTFQLLDASGAPATTGSVTINSRTIAAAAGSNQVIYDMLQPGTYTATFNVNGTPTTTTVVIGTDSGQTYILVQGINSTGGITVSGRLLDASTTADSCITTTGGFTPTILIRVRQVLPDGSRPVVASVTKPIQKDKPADEQGLYIVSGIPKPGTYTVEVRPIAGDNSPYTGNGPTFTANTANQVVPNIDVCVHGNATPPPAG